VNFTAIVANPVCDINSKMSKTCSLMSTHGLELYCRAPQTFVFLCERCTTPTRASSAGGTPPKLEGKTTPQQKGNRADGKGIKYPFSLFSFRA
jgi:hypothetical protein